MNIALFGGTFDPIHVGHVRAAQAAARRFRLDRVLFVPTGNPPHKYPSRLTPFHHRYAMVALACAADRRFIPSLLEAPTPDGMPHYTIHTARAAHRMLDRGDRLYFLLGADAFLDLPHWKDHEKLLGLVNFIVVSRPGFTIRDIEKVVPQAMGGGSRRRRVPDTIHLRRTAIHILRGLDAHVASRDIREVLRAGRTVTGLVPPLVEEYIRKEGLFGSGRPGHRKQ